MAEYFFLPFLCSLFSVLTWAIYYLSQDEKVVKKMLNEIEEVLGENDVTMEMVDKLVYVILGISFSILSYFIAWIFHGIKISRFRGRIKKKTRN